MDLSGIFQKVQEAQAKLKQAKENLGSISTTGEAGAGMVKVTVNGNRQVQSIEVDDAVINVEEKHILQDLIVAATNKALETIEEKIKEEMSKSTDGILPNIPGFDLGNMM